MPGVRLLYCDLEVDPTNGETVVVGTLGGLKDPELPGYTVDPDHLELAMERTAVRPPDRRDHEKDCANTTETDPTDLHITVSTVFLVHLNGRPEVTIRPGEAQMGGFILRATCTSMRASGGIDLCRYSVGRRRRGGRVMSSSDEVPELPRPARRPQKELGAS